MQLQVALETDADSPPKSSKLLNSLPQVDLSSRALLELRMNFRLQSLLSTMLKTSTL